MLYESDGMTDVTLCCEEGRVRAHKLILSTCSDYFLVSILLKKNISKKIAENYTTLIVSFDLESNILLEKVSITSTV